jgi:N-acetylneuraminate synthase
LYITQDMLAGEIFSTGNLRAIRPGLGLPPKYLDEFLGKPITMAAKRGTPLTRAHVADGR